MSGDIAPSKRQKTQLVLGQWLTPSSRGEDNAVGASRSGSSSSTASSAGRRGNNEPEQTSAIEGGESVGEKWAKYGASRRGGRPQVRPGDEEVHPRRSPAASGGDTDSGSFSYNKGGRHVSVPSSALEGAGFKDAGAAKAAKTGGAIDLAEGDPRFSRAAAAAAADGVVDLTGGGGSRKRGARGREAVARKGEGAGMLPPAANDPATSLKLRELLEDLCEEQRHVVDLVLRGKSVFFTGAAGTGKSFLLKKLHKALDLVGKGETTFMTGTTGKAAVGIGGCTIHSFAGIGLGNQSVSDTLRKVMSSKAASTRWRTCDVLVIDEISMMEADLFDKLNLVGQRVRGSPQPFGGVQLVLCGDFYQLPPIGIGRGSVGFCFEATTWDTALDQSIVLKQVFRQKDPLFLKILHEMREGRVDPEARRILSQKVEQARQQARIAATEAGAAAAAAGNAANKVETSEGGVFEQSGSGCNGSGGGGGEPGRAPTYTRLFSRNEDVNRLNERELRKLPGDPELYHAEDSGEPAFLRQLQNNCAAPTVLELKVGAKVLLLKNIDTGNHLVNGSTGVVLKLEGSSRQRFAVVEFDVLEGKATSVVRQEEWTITMGDREVARRVQLPLRLAWALSVHKAQGMTIANVMVSTQGMFEFGQAYVALSRATTLDGLQLLDFRLGVVRAHDKVKAFYAALEAVPARAMPPIGAFALPSTTSAMGAGGSAEPSPTMLALSPSEYLQRLGRALGGPSRAVTAVPRQGKAAPKPGEWMPRRSPNSDFGRESCASPLSVARRRPGIEDEGGISPAARERMEENRRRALAKLAEKRAKAQQAGEGT